MCKMCVCSNLVSSLLESHRRMRSAAPGGLSRTTDKAVSAAMHREPRWLSLQI